MKNRIASGAAAIVLGLLISLGPYFLFKVCEPVEAHDGSGTISWMKCHWSVQAEIGIGALISALGLALLVLKSKETRTGLSIGVFLSAVLVLLIPHALIGGCAMPTMPCRAVTFPSLTVLGILLLTGAAANIFYLRKTRITEVL
jgi:cytochrome bd-type quinol oxidase subunit 2